MEHQQPHQTRNQTSDLGFPSIQRTRPQDCTLPDFAILHRTESSRPPASSPSTPEGLYRPIPTPFVTARPHPTIPLGLVLGTVLDDVPNTIQYRRGQGDCSVCCGLTARARLGSWPSSSRPIAPFGRFPFEQANKATTRRHRDSLVVRDPSSQSLEIRSLSECPTCHRPLRSASAEHHFERPAHNDSYVDPGYFRMLRDRHVSSQHASAFNNPPSPIRRLAQPVLPQGGSPSDGMPEDEVVSHGLTPNERNRIRRDAFSPNYFNTFFVEEQELGRGGKGVVLLVRHEIDGCHLGTSSPGLGWSLCDASSPERLKSAALELTHIAGHFACKRVPVGDDHAWLEKGGSTSKARYNAGYPT